MVLVDGKRMDVGLNSATGGSRSKTNISMLIGIDNIERVEVVKGQGAIVYGGDATNVINIVTKKGSYKPSGSFDFDMGSWGKQNITFNYNGILRFSRCIYPEQKGIS